jgi:hypothetical protein
MTPPEGHRAGSSLPSLHTPVLSEPRSDLREEVPESPPCPPPCQVAIGGSIALVLLIVLYVAFFSGDGAPPQQNAAMTTQMGGNNLLTNGELIPPVCFYLVWRITDGISLSRVICAGAQLRPQGYLLHPRQRYIPGGGGIKVTPPPRG